MLKSSTAHCTVTMLRRSLQTPNPNEPYLTEGHDVIDIINQAIKEDGYNKLRDIAIEIGKAWLHKDNASRIRLAAFSCEILLLIHPLYNTYLPIKEAFLNSKIEKLNRLKEKLMRGANPSRRERKFIKALRLGSLYDKWLEAIRGQAKRVLKKTEPR
ncbi:hypothetical protein FOTG_14686 [Fusarium oxysporum f. sp. vasinfectum 25433]|uniref:Uncharacterized protein n=1 Tax=Fusarium oxysporum f. sp. vasinfectum 25433 TaxID=1089449 RepID=X0L7K6_FUSOX|nr:hypothetical protein FOTG_14686 [Fusarium oxysporum f. sp. vasinfectum 25433]